MNLWDVINGFISLFLLVKDYINWLVVELSQLCYRGVLRAIALGTTDGLCTWRVNFLMGLQPVIVPVGRITLGRIYNVVGSVIDLFTEQPLSSQYNIVTSIDLGLLVESTADTSFTQRYIKHLLQLGSFVSYAVENLISLFYYLFNMLDTFTHVFSNRDSNFTPNLLIQSWTFYI